MFVCLFVCMFSLISYFDAVSGTSIYESWVYTGFNFILGLPIIFYGIQDRDVSDAFAMQHPQVRHCALMMLLWMLTYMYFFGVSCAKSSKFN